MAGVDKFDGEELAAVFAEVFEMFATDEPNAVLVTTELGARNKYDESDVRWESLKNIHIINIGNPEKQAPSTAGDLGTSKTWILANTETAPLIDTGSEIIYKGKRYIIRQWETKEVRGVDLIGYGFMERVPKQ